MLVPLALITGDTVFANLGKGNDTLTVDSSGGLVSFANGIRFNAATGFDKLIVHQDAGGPTHTSAETLVGASPAPAATSLSAPPALYSESTSSTSSRSTAIRRK